MKTTRRIKITTIRRRSMRIELAVIRGRCPVCRREVEVLGRIQAAQFLDIAPAVLDGLVARGQIHVVETNREDLSLCKDSLLLGDYAAKP